MAHTPEELERLRNERIESKRDRATCLVCGLVFCPTNLYEVKLHSHPERGRITELEAKAEELLADFVKYGDHVQNGPHRCGVFLMRIRMPMECTCGYDAAAKKWRKSNG